MLFVTVIQGLCRASATVEVTPHGSVSYGTKLYPAGGSLIPAGSHKHFLVMPLELKIFPRDLVGGRIYSSYGYVNSREN